MFGRLYGDANVVLPTSAATLPDAVGASSAQR